MWTVDKIFFFGCVWFEGKHLILLDVILWWKNSYGTLHKKGRREEEMGIFFLIIENFLNQNICNFMFIDEIKWLFFVKRIFIPTKHSLRSKEGHIWNHSPYLPPLDPHPFVSNRAIQWRKNLEVSKRNLYETNTAFRFNLAYISLPS